jgi:hypothetical protein
MNGSDLVPLAASATQEALFAAVELVAKEEDSPQARNHLNALLSPH